MLAMICIARKEVHYAVDEQAVVKYFSRMSET